MKIRTFLPAVLAFATTAAFAADATFDKTLTVSGSPQVSVATGSGYIHLHPGATNRSTSSATFTPQRLVHERLATSTPASSRSPPTRPSPRAAARSPSATATTTTSTATSPSTTTSPSPAPPPSSPHPAPAISTSRASAPLSKRRPAPAAVHARGIQGPANLQTGSGNIELDEAGPGDVRAQTGSGTIHLTRHLRWPTGPDRLRRNRGRRQAHQRLEARHRLRQHPPHRRPDAPPSTSTPPPAPAESTSLSPSTCRATSIATTSPQPSTAAAPPSRPGPAPAASASNNPPAQTKEVWG